MTITLNGTTGITTPDVTSDGLTVDSTTLVVDEANNRVGVGTSSPAKQLHIESSTGGTIRLSSSDTTVGAGESLGEIDWYSNDASSGGSGVRAFVNVVENDGGLGRAYAMTFGTGNVGTASERARIDSSGNFLVGTTSGIYNFTLQSNSSRSLFPQAILASDATSGTHYMIGFKKSDGGTVGSITHNTTTTAYNTSSDYRLKEDWVPVINASTRVTALKPVNFAWKTDGKRVDGFLAHELAEVVPEAVTGEKDAVDADGNPEYQGIDQSKLVPLLTAALQEALAEIETLKARISALEAA